MMRFDRFFFLHIPKTAGTSLHYVLGNLASPFLHLSHPHQRRWPAALIWNRFRGCGGHIYWSDAEKQGLLNALKIAFFRDPVKRVLSQFAFSSQESVGDRPEAILARQLSLRTMISEESGHFGSFWNLQTFALSGLPRTELSPEAHLASALENLERLDFIGTTETFEEDIVELKSFLGASSIPVVPHENRSNTPIQRTELDAETLALLKNSQRLDFVLYRRAVELRKQRSPITLNRDETSPPGWPPQTIEKGTGDAHISRCTIRAVAGEELRSGDNAEVTLEYSTVQALDNITIGLMIEDQLGQYIAGTNTLLLNKSRLQVPTGTHTAMFRFPLSMGPGSYSLTAALHRGSEEICWLESAASFEVATALHPYREGMVNIDARFEVTSEAPLNQISEDAAPLVFLEIRPSRVSQASLADFSIPIRLGNHSRSMLGSSGSAPVLVSYHWRDISGDVRILDGVRTSLPRYVWPGEEVEFQVAVAPPPSPGRWILQLRIVQESVRWHEGASFGTSVPPDLFVDLLPDQSLRLIGFRH